MGMALVKKRVENFVKVGQGNAVLAISKGHFTGCTLLTRWSASVFKSGRAMWIVKLIKEDWYIW